MSIKGPTVDVSELVKRMDAMKPKFKYCAGYEGHDCDSTFNLDDWNALTPIKQSQIRQGLDWYIKPKIMANGHTGYTIDARCKKCKYQFEQSARVRGGGQRNRDNRGHTGPVDKAERLFFCELPAINT